jgi:ribose-phosphate pyrophosphokinase
MLLIDSDNYSAAGIKTMFFPGGEPHVKVPLEDESVVLLLKLRNWNDVGFGALVVDAFQRQGRLKHVFIPYFPAARQDKTDGRAALSLHVMGRLFGSTPVSVFDPHSTRIHEHVKVERAYMPADLSIAVKEDVVGIIAPDAGAEARAAHFHKRFHPQADLILASKKRDQQTGALSNYQLPQLKRAGRYIIVDDICDGGGTFNLLAEEFAKRAAELAGPSVLELFVSHGIFSKGLAALSPTISAITTTDSWCRLAASERLTVVSLVDIVQRLMQGISEGEEHA